MGSARPAFFYYALVFVFKVVCGGFGILCLTNMVSAFGLFAQHLAFGVNNDHVSVADPLWRGSPCYSLCHSLKYREKLVINSHLLLFSYPKLYMC
ncbi:DUF3265 domain-containing protein [Vibrio mytili]